jgi:hypothetical protein
MAHCGSLGCPRDDKKERVVAGKGRLLDERAVAEPRHRWKPHIHRLAVEGSVLNLSIWQMSCTEFHLQCTPGQVEGQSAFLFVGGEDFVFSPVRPQDCPGAGRVWGEGFCGLTSQTIFERVRFPAGCSWRRRLRVPGRSRCRIQPCRLRSKQTRKSAHHSPTRFR